MKPNSGNISGIAERGDSRDIAARAAGLGSGKTLEAAQRVVEHGLSRRHQHVGAGPVLVLVALYHRQDTPSAADCAG